MKVFLDVGAHTGETLRAVVDPALAFDRIVCFEPAPSCWPKILEVVDPRPLKSGVVRVSLERFGLWNRNCKEPVFQPGTRGAGIWKKDGGRTDETLVCRFVRASDWFRENIRDDDEVYLKLNCEGAECDILDDLLDSGEFEKVSFLMADFDVRKIAAQRHREAEIRERLAGVSAPRFATSKQVMRGDTHEARIKHWLGTCR